MSDKEFGEYIATLREKQGYKSQRKFAETCGVSNGAIARIENGTQKPKPATLKRLAQYLDVTFDELMKKAGYTEFAEFRNQLVHSDIAKVLESDKYEKALRFASDFVFTSRKMKNSLSDEEKDQRVSIIQIGELNKFESSEELYEYITSFPIQVQVNFLLSAFMTMNPNELVTQYNFKRIMQEPKEIIVSESSSEYMSNTQTATVPLLGSIPAGHAVIAIEDIEEYRVVPNQWGYDENDLFLLRVKGDSMIGSRIYENDLVLIKRQPDVESGEIAVVNVNGDDATLKRVKKIDGQVILFPDNPKYEPTLINNEKARIIGKVVQVMFEP